jgi:hypothetical protein
VAVTEQEIANAYFACETIEALLSENFDAEPEWRQVKVKDLAFGPDGIFLLEVMILKDGRPTFQCAVIPPDTFATSLRAIVGRTS